MKNKTVRGMYDDGELRFAEPVDVDGCWNLEITFVEEIDEEGIPVEADPHRAEILANPNRLEEAHRQIEVERPHIGPF